MSRSTLRTRDVPTPCSAPCPRAVDAILDVGSARAIGLRRSTCSTCGWPACADAAPRQGAADRRAVLALADGRGRSSRAACRARVDRQRPRRCRAAGRRRRRARRPGRPAAGRRPRACVGDATRSSGCSTHTPQQVERARAASRSTYVAIGPVFATTTKTAPATAVGLDGVRSAAAIAHDAAACRSSRSAGSRSRRPPHVLDAGAASVAVISDLLVGDPAIAVREYLRRLALTTLA